MRHSLKGFYACEKCGVYSIPRRIGAGRYCKKCSDALYSTEKAISEEIKKHFPRENETVDIRCRRFDIDKMLQEFTEKGYFSKDMDW